MWSSLLRADHRDQRDQRLGLPDQRRTGRAPTWRAPLVVVAGGPGSNPGALVERLTAVPVPSKSEAFILLRPGATHRSRAFVPGRHQPVADPTRLHQPPRRIEIDDPAELLRQLSLVIAPEVTDWALADLVLDVLDRAVGLVFVTDTPSLPPSQVELVAQASTVVGNISMISAAAPVEELERLRRTLGDWVAGPAPTASALVAGQVGIPVGSFVLPAGGTPTIQVSTDDLRWRAELDRELGEHQAAAGRQLALDLAAMRERCRRALHTCADQPDLAALLDRELHAVSVRANRGLARAGIAVIGVVCGALLEDAPDEAIIERTSAEVRRILDERDDERPWTRALLLTTTGEVGAATSRAALAGLTVLGCDDPAPPLFVPFGVVLTESCHRWWLRPGADTTADRQAWLDRALCTVERDILREVDRRLDELRQALVVIAAEAVDHGVLLA